MSFDIALLFGSPVLLWTLAGRLVLETVDADSFGGRLGFAGGTLAAMAAAAFSTAVTVLWTKRPIAAEYDPLVDPVPGSPYERGRAAAEDSAFRHRGSI